MYNSIQQFVELGREKVEKKIKGFIEERKDIGDLVIGLQEELNELGCNMVKEVLEDMDEYLRKSGARKQQWEVVRKDPTSLMTSFGMVRYKRTYYKRKNGKERRYLVDELVGIKPHDCISADVVINVLEEALDSSYRKGGERASPTESISKQAVMNKVHELEIVQPEVSVRRDDVRVLYIEADEDHVAQQGRKGKAREQGKSPAILMPKIVYVHEGIDWEKSKGKRRALKNPRYFGGLMKSEDLWLEVAGYLEEAYEMDRVETIYLSGDGATWIKQGLYWIPKSRFVLDGYHLCKYVTTATAHIKDEAIVQGLKDALDEADKGILHKVFERILELTAEETKRQGVLEAKRYFLNHWEGIEVKVDNREIVGCSAEGHVSHIYADRLSSRPMGWSKTGADKMAQLRIFKKNGGKIYDLVMAQKRKAKREERSDHQDELIRELRRAYHQRQTVWDAPITVLKKGHKTVLYNCLRGIAGF